MCHQVSKPQKMKPSLNQEEILWAPTEKKKQNKTASLSVFSWLDEATFWKQFIETLVASPLFWLQPKPHISDYMLKAT